MALHHILRCRLTILFLFQAFRQAYLRPTGFEHEWSFPAPSDGSVQPFSVHTQLQPLPEFSHLSFEAPLPLHIDPHHEVTFRTSFDTPSVLRQDQAHGVFRPIPTYHQSWDDIAQSLNLGPHRSRFLDDVHERFELLYPERGASNSAFRSPRTTLKAEVAATDSERLKHSPLHKPPEGWSESLFDHFGRDIGDLEKWQQSIRRVLGSESFQIKPLHSHNPRYNRVYIAEDINTIQGAHHGPYRFPDLNPSTEHFLNGMKTLRKIDVKDLPDSPSKIRHFIFLNSRANLEYINANYFLNSLRFLQINPTALTRATLMKTLYNRRTHYILPPMTEHGFPLLMDRIQQTKASSRDVPGLVEVLTGEPKNRHIVALWSPFLWDGKRYTSIFYGLAQFDDLFRSQLGDHWRTLYELRPQHTYSPLYSTPEGAESDVFQEALRRAAAVKA